MNPRNPASHEPELTGSRRRRWAALFTALIATAVLAAGAISGGNNAPLASASATHPGSGAAVRGAPLGGPAPVSLIFHFANLPAKAAGVVDFNKGVQAIPLQTALSNSPGTIRFFVAHQRGFTIQAADNAPLDAEISFTPEPTANASAYSGHATVPQGATLTVQVGVGGAIAQIPDGDFSIPLTPLGAAKPH